MRRGPHSGSSKRARVNHQINAKEVRLIDAEGQQVGIISIQEALQKAQEANLDLVEIAPQLTPPVCRVMDFGKYLFEQRKRLKKKSKRVQVKELKMRPVTDIGDYLIKIKKATTFLQAGDKVKLTVRFRGRELSYQQQGIDILRRAENDLKDYGTVEQTPKMEGKQMVMLIVPGKSKNN
ncbi:MAG TPA: translation initiation factor IF-3 [Coxiellaceae bacterium]|nr:MAG: translation initiation factor IF-3 [Gammaproteobacteria bacterium RBG_16_37_9]HBC71988.1 translation initiation factor IF-3 [Coxiellaceae bacterium]HBS51878.1 translation initiation factor IF-3 [Coxiellaceae bacterium]HBY56075.1 translation initiation factor IF-3 [Coxiellaceae bacterium]